MSIRKWPNIFQTASLLLLVLLALPFVLYATSFGRNGLTDSLPEPHYLFTTNPSANLAVFGHMLSGAIITLMAPFQLISPLRRRAPRLHRWSGRIIAVAAVLTAVAGLIFIALRGTIGGAAMDAGFTLYGSLVLICAVQTYLHGRARRLGQHRVWALRLFWLAIGSWLYRVQYGLWYLATDGLWSTPEFTGAFDLFQNFGFYLPYLLALEIYLRNNPNLAADIASR